MWHLLSRSESEMIHRIYTTQNISSSVGDWVRLVQADKLELGIEVSDREIQGVSKDVFNSFVKKKVKVNMLKYLAEQKKKHSKAAFLKCDELKMAEYLQDPRFTTYEKQLLFKLRSKTINVEENVKGMNSTPWCTSCGLFRETQGHLLQCPELVKCLNYLHLKPSRINENLIYGRIDQQEMMVKIYSDILEARENLKNSL